MISVSNLISVSNTSKLFLVCVFAAPCVLRDGGRDAECAQPDLSVQRRQAVLLEPGHAVTAPGQHGAAAQAVQVRGRHLLQLPVWRCQQLHRGLGGVPGVLSLSTWQVRTSLGLGRGQARNLNMSFGECLLSVCCAICMCGCSVCSMLFFGPLFHDVGNLG